MAALDRYLAHDEQVVLDVRRHLAVLARPAAVVAGVIVLAVVVGVVLTPESTHGVVDTICGVVALFFVLRLAWRVWEWWADRIVVTDERIFEVSGVLTRRVASMPVSRVTDMTYKRTIGGRIFGYGEIIVETAGQEQGLSAITFIPEPDHFYRTVTSLVTAGLPKLVEDGAAGPDRQDTGPLPRVPL